MIGKHWSFRFRLLAIATLAALSLGAACPESALLYNIGTQSQTYYLERLGPNPYIKPWRIYDHLSKRNFFEACPRSGVNCVRYYEGTAGYSLILSFFLSRTIAIYMHMSTQVPDYGPPAPPPL